MTTNNGLYYTYDCDNLIGIYVTAGTISNCNENYCTVTTTCNWSYCNRPETTTQTVPTKSCGSKNLAIYTVLVLMQISIMKIINQ